MTGSGRDLIIPLEDADIDAANAREPDREAPSDGKRRRIR